ncbi:MAG: glycosyltransferase family 4 protein [Anaerolineae bacterium]
MRVLHANAGYWPFVGGAETYLRAISERLVRDGHQVTVAATDAGGVQCYWDPRQPRITRQEEIVSGVRVIRSRLSHLPLSPWSFYLLRRLATDVARLPINMRPVLDRLAPFMPWVPDMQHRLEALGAAFDLVHGVNIALEWPLLAGWQYARRHGLPFVATPFVHVGERTVQRFYTMPHQLAALRDADRVIVQTSIEAQELARLAVPQSKIVRLGMGVDLDEVRGGEGARFRAQHGIDGAVVTFMGVLTDDKGVVHLLRAMQQVWQSGSEATLVLAGPVVKPSSIEMVYKSLPEDHRTRIRCLGPVTGQLKQDLLAATDVFALPSRVDSFGIVYLEAWAYGVPVIGCRAGGVPDVIDQGVDGLLVDFGDVAALASTIEALLAAPEKRQAMGRAGRAKVKAHYTWEHIYRKLLTVYEELVG